MPERGRHMPETGLPRTLVAGKRTIVEAASGATVIGDPRSPANEERALAMAGSQLSATNSAPASGRGALLLGLLLLISP